MVTTLVPNTAAFPLPDPPSRDPHCLDDADHQLGHEGEEESHEAEGTVCPAREGSVTPAPPSLLHSKRREVLPRIRPGCGLAGG